MPPSTTTFVSVWTTNSIWLRAKHRLACPLVDRSNRKQYGATFALYTPRATLIGANERATSEQLDQFASAVRGEWRGYEGRFHAQNATVQPIPDYYVPDEFSEWGVRPNGFETNHSTIVRKDTLYRKFLRVLPTVTLFADHVDVEEDSTQILLTPTDDVSTAIFSDGSFVTGAPQVATRRESRLDKWPTLLLSVQDPRSNFRRSANVWVKLDFEHVKFADDVRVVIENWADEFSDSPELEGSSGFIDGWVSDSCTEPDVLAGRWVEDEGKDVGDNGDRHVITRSGHADEGMSRLLLPNGLDVSIHSHDGLTVQVGWLVDGDTRIIVCRRFAQDGAVEHSRRSVERRLSD